MFIAKLTHQSLYNKTFFSRPDNIPPYLTLIGRLLFFYFLIKGIFLKKDLTNKIINYIF